MKKNYAIVKDGKGVLFVCQIKELGAEEYLNLKLQAAERRKESDRLNLIKEKRLDELAQAVCALQAEIKHLKGEDEDVGND